MDRREFVQGQAGASQATCSTTVFAFSSFPIFLFTMICCCVAGFALSSLDCTGGVGEKEEEKTAKTTIFLPAVGISLFWEFHPRRAFPVVKAGRFWSFLCFLRSHEPMTGE